ncbi:MAG: hypothetical protein Q8R24_04580 [Legionellaceae bacterium]|nr:hypothetical protein [Legionellaceae bacterium]
MRNPEEEIIQALTQSPEATMGQDLSNSIGMALLTLRENYLGPEAVTEEEIAHQEALLQAMSAWCRGTLYSLRVEDFFKKGEWGDPNYAALKNELSTDLPSVIDFIIARTRDPLSWLDRVTLYRTDETGEFHEKDYLLPLHTVLPLLVKSYLDDAKFSQSYSGGAKEQLEQAISDRPLRLFSLFKCFKRAQKGLCHTGVRHELVSLLNQVYDGIHLVENIPATALSFFRDEINQRFWLQYNATSNEDKKALLTLLFRWMETQSAVEIVAVIDPDQAIKHDLNQLILKQGINPKTLHVQYNQKQRGFADFMDELLSHLNFTAPSDSILNKLDALLNADTEHPHYITRNQARLRLIDWIKTHFKLNSVTSEKLIYDFYLIDEAVSQLIQNKQLLYLTNLMTPEVFQSFMNRFDAYYQTTTESNGVILLKAQADVLEAAQQCIIQMRGAREENIAEKIRDFFAVWFVAQKINDYPTLRAQYAVLLDPYLVQKIRITDEALTKFITQNNRIEYSGPHR